MMGIYNILLWIPRKEDISTILFGVFCIIIFLRLLGTNSFYQRIFSSASIHWLQLKIEFITAALGWTLLLDFIISLFKEEFSNIISKIFIISGLIIALSIVFIPVHIFTYFTFCHYIE